MSEHSKIEWTDATWNPLGDVRRLVPAASTAMQRHSQNAFVAFPATLTNRPSIYAWFLKNYLSRFCGHRRTCVC